MKELRQKVLQIYPPPPAPSAAAAAGGAEAAPLLAVRPPSRKPQINLHQPGYFV